MTRPTITERANRPLKGQVTIMFACSLLFLLAAAALGVDAVGAWTCDQKQEDALIAVREAVMGQENYIKYSDTNSAEPISSSAAALNAALGCLTDMYGEGTTSKDLEELGVKDAKIWAWELPRSKTGPADRIIGVEVKLTGAFRTTFARTIGIDEIPITNGIIFTVHPYSSQEVYGSRTNGDGWTTTAISSPHGLHDVGSTRVDYDALPRELRDALEKSAAEIERER